MRFSKLFVIMAVLVFGATESNGQIKLEHLSKLIVTAPESFDNGMKNLHRFESVSTKEQPVSVLLLPAVHSCEQPFFCQIEDRVSSKSKLPVRFRIGETSYVDNLEEKFGRLLRF